MMTNLIILVFIVFKMLNNEMCFPSVLLGDFEKIVDLVQLLAVSISVPHTLHTHTHPPHHPPTHHRTHTHTYTHTHTHTHTDTHTRTHTHTHTHTHRHTHT